MDASTDLLLFLLGTSGVAITISSTKIFEPFRNFFSKRKSKNNFYKFISDLLSCAICLSVWAGAFMLILHDHFPYAYRFIAHATGCVAGLYWLMVYRRL